MAESISDLRLMFKIEARGASESLFRLSQIAQDFEVVARRWSAMLDPLWAVVPGEWPDKFILLNRYLRTGTRPPFIFNE